MRKFHLITPALGLALVVGCESKSPPGGPNAPHAKSPSGPVVGTADNTFRLKVPATEMSIKQGETKEMSIGIDRGTGFSQDVELSFENLPPGITVTPASGKLPASENEPWKVMVSAAANAALGHQKITVVGKPATGSKTTTTVNVEVKAGG
jgi:hypothetical protein